jgi:hypothetical protein
LENADTTGLFEDKESVRSVTRVADKHGLVESRKNRFKNDGGKTLDCSVHRWWQ